MVNSTKNSPKISSKIKYLIFIFLPVLGFGSTLFIGNGGEVFKMGNNYFSRDLVEANSYEKPFFYCQNANDFLKKVDPQLVATLQLDENLLAQKLCDLDSISPKVAQIFIDATYLHTWTLIYEKLGLLPDDGPLLAPSSAERLQAANRTLYNIRIYAPIWSFLNPQNKIALFFHEIIFSLLKFNCVNESCSQFMQSARIARQITGLLFSELSFTTQEGKRNLDNLIQLSLNSNTPQSYDGKVRFDIRISYTLPQGEYILGQKKKANQSLESFAQATCENYVSMKKNLISLKLIFYVIKQDGFTLEKVSYPSPYGIEYGIKIINFTSANMNSLTEVDSLEICYQNLLLKIKEFLE